MSWSMRFLLVAMIVGGTVHAYIYEIKVLRRWDESKKRYQYIVGLSDFHDKTHEINKQQVAYLENLFKRCVVHQPKIIIEDISSPGLHGRMTCGRFYIDSRGGILGGLTKLCHETGIQNVDNIEYRYCRVTSLGPLATAVQVEAATIPSTAAIMVGDLLSEVEDLMTEVELYFDGSQLKRHYDAILKEVRKEIAHLQLRESKNLSVAKYITQRSSLVNRFELVKRLLTFDSVLLDAKMLHQIYDFHEGHTMIAIAGGAHIARVSDMLESEGYELMHSSKVTMMRETDLHKCIGCNVIEGKCCLKPCPIDITFVDNYL